ncbi:trehalose 6-phosphatase [Litorimonas taeanensis]|uniref:Trehalose 6-phosphate phosphatase n=1 Tax=Litorimonas taeanensis TaxID=568099 RepID=A0A420WFR2_9PROT|nr:trehalose-phosphatase [Litorimonas taeanensis]RKQ69799.1 trehalose 6-phosphatase [Litorimonas taeanensis]
MAVRITDSFDFPTNMALFLDFDGTLAGFKDDPDTVKLMPQESALILNLANHLSGALALISGRDLRDLSKRVPNSLWRLGNHGLYSAAPYEDPPTSFTQFPTELKAKLEANLSHLNGIWFEDKGPVLAIHHRAKPESGPEISSCVEAEIKAYPLHIMQLGHNVIEIKPADANKGAALTRQMRNPAFANRIPVMIGDDTTDEDAFRAAETFGGFGIKMAHQEMKQSETAARFYIETIQDLYGLLGTLL